MVQSAFVNFVLLWMIIYLDFIEADIRLLRQSFNDSSEPSKEVIRFFRIFFGFLFITIVYASYIGWKGYLNPSYKRISNIHHIERSPYYAFHYLNYSYFWNSFDSCNISHYSIHYNDNSIKYRIRNKGRINIHLKCTHNKCFTKFE